LTVKTILYNIQLQFVMVFAAREEFDLSAAFFFVREIHIKIRLEEKMKGTKSHNRNAATHGIFARILLKDDPFGEDQDDFVKLRSMLCGSIRPVGGLEETLVDVLAVLFFRLIRLYRADMKIAPRLFKRIAELLGPGQPAIKARWTSPDDQVIVVQRDPTSDSLMRYETSLEKQIARTLGQIESCQRMRREQPALASSASTSEAPHA
jgi:hypothetical protein